MTGAAETNPAPKPRIEAVRLVHLLAGGLLIVAAVFKAYQAVLPGPAVALHLRLLELAQIELELALGAMLVLGAWPVVGWGLAAATYALFAAVSLRKAIAGAKGCGCFGPAAVDPKLMTAIDLAIVVALLIVGPQAVRAMRNRRARIVVIGFMILIAAGVAFNAIPKRGLVVASGADFDFGILTPDRATSCEHVFALRNTAPTPLRITRVKSSCGCTSVDAPATAIEPGAVATVRVRADWSAVVGRTASTVTLQTNSHWTPQIALTVSGEVRATKEPTSSRLLAH